MASKLEPGGSHAEDEEQNTSTLESGEGAVGVDVVVLIKTDMLG